MPRRRAARATIRAPGARHPRRRRRHRAADAADHRAAARCERGGVRGVSGRGPYRCCASPGLSGCRRSRCRSARSPAVRLGLSLIGPPGRDRALMALGRSRDGGIGLRRRASWRPASIWPHSVGVYSRRGAADLARSPDRSAPLLLGDVRCSSPALPAAAHPHVFVDAKAEIVFDEEGRIDGGPPHLAVRRGVLRLRHPGPRRRQRRQAQRRRARSRSPRSMSSR